MLDHYIHTFEACVEEEPRIDFWVLIPCLLGGLFLVVLGLVTLYVAKDYIRAFPGWKRMFLALPYLVTVVAGCRLGRFGIDEGMQ